MMNPHGNEARVLVLAPIGRDAELVCDTLSRAGLHSVACENLADLHEKLTEGAATILMTEEALTQQAMHLLKTLKENQPPWSNMPLVLLVSGRWQGLKALEYWGSVTVLERPTRITPLVTVTHLAVRARQQQYQIRDLLRQHEHINEVLEQRVQERTHELQIAHAQAETERQHFSQMFQAGPVAACLITLKTGQFVRTNESFQMMTGYTAAELTGSTIYELGMWSSGEDQRKINKALESHSNYRNLELHLLTKEKDSRTIIASAEIMEIAEERCLLHMFYDITERKRSEEELMQAVQEVMSDTTWFSRSLLEKIAQIKKRQRGEADEPPVAISRLTPREQQVLERMASGHDNNRIATDLGLAEQTVRNYITNIYDKLAVHSRADAIIWARERGLSGY